MLSNVLGKENYLSEDQSLIIVHENKNTDYVFTIEGRFRNYNNVRAYLAFKDMAFVVTREMGFYTVMISSEDSKGKGFYKVPYGKSVEIPVNRSGYLVAVYLSSEEDSERYTIYFMSRDDGSVYRVTYSKGIIDTEAELAYESPVASAFKSCNSDVIRCVNSTSIYHISIRSLVLDLLKEASKA